MFLKNIRETGLLPNHRNQFFIWLITFFSSLLYVNTILNNYNLDDELVTINHRLTSKGFSAIPEIFLSPYYQDNMGYAYEYRPIVLATFAIEHQLFGDNPHISHLINVLLYALLCVLLFFTLLRLWPEINKFFVVVVVLLFASHPLHTEVVASIKNRDEILAMIGAVLSLLMLLYYFDSKQLHFYALSILFFFIALLSKKTIVISIISLPLLIILYRKINILPLLIFVALCFIISVPVLELSNWDSVLLYFTLFISSTVFFYLLKNPPNLTPQFLISKVNAEQKEADDIRLIPIIGISQFLLIYCAIIFSIGILYYTKNPFFLYPSALLLLLPLLVKDSALNVSIILFTTISIIYLALFKNEVYFLMFFMILIFMYQWLKFSKNYKLIIGIIAFVYIATTICFLTGYIESGMIINASFLLVFFYLSTTRLKLIPLLFYLTAFIKGIFSMATLGATSLINYVFTFEIFYFFILVIYFYSDKLIKYLIPLAILILPFIVLKDMTSFPGYNLPKKLLAPMENLDKSKIPVFIEKDIDRPLNFVETSTPLNATFIEKSGTGIVILGRYLKLLLLPYPMSYYYGYKEINVYPLTHYIPALILIAHLLLFFFAVYTINKNKILSGAILFYLIMIIPYSNLIYPVPGMMGDRFVFVPSLGFVIILSWLIFKYYKVKLFSSQTSWETISNKFKLSLSVLLILYSSITIARNFQWKDHLTLMRNDIKHLESSAQAHNLLATNLMKYSFKKDYSNDANKMREEAIIHYRKSLNIYPDFFNVWFNLGKAYLTLNDIDNAYGCFVKVHDMDSTLSEATLNVALIANSKGDTKTAEKYFERLITISPYVLDGYNYLSYIYFNAGKFEESINVNKKAIQYNPSWKEPYINISQVYLHLKDTLQAQLFIQKASQINSGK